MEKIINFIFVAVGCIIFVGILIRVCKNSFGSVKEAEATVADKQIYTKRIMSKKQAPYDKKEYTVTFVSGKKKFKFVVSPISYNSYNLHQKGLLKYRGSKLLEFKSK